VSAMARPHLAGQRHGASHRQAARLARFAQMLVVQCAGDVYPLRTGGDAHQMFGQKGAERMSIGLGVWCGIVIGAALILLVLAWVWWMGADD
jgi:hypothetical protein